MRRSSGWKEPSRSTQVPSCTRISSLHWEKIIERAGEVEVNAAAVVSAVSSYARIKSARQWVERSEHVDLNQLFDKMSASELEEYARDGRLPEWFNSTTGTATSQILIRVNNDLKLRDERLAVVATQARPGWFPLGSVESRATARALAAAKAERSRLQPELQPSLSIL